MLGVNFIRHALKALPLREATRSITYEKTSSIGTNLFIEGLTSSDSQPIIAKVRFSIIATEPKRNLTNADMPPALTAIAGELEQFIGKTHSAYLSVYQNNNWHAKNITKDQLSKMGFIADFEAITYYKKI